MSTFPKFLRTAGSEDNMDYEEQACWDPEKMYEKTEKSTKYEKDKAKEQSP